MKKKSIMMIAAGIVLAGGIGLFVLFFLLKGREFVVRIPEKELAEKINQKMPFTKTYLILFEVTLANPRIDLVEKSERINGGVDVTVKIKIDHEAKDLVGKIDLSGGVRYAAETGEFFLVDPHIERVSIAGLSEKYTTQVGKALGAALSAFYTKHAIYTLRSSDLKKTAARLLLKSIVVDQQELVVTLGW